MELVPIILSMLKLKLVMSSICNFTVTYVYLCLSANEGYRQADMRCAELGSRVDELTYNNSMLEGQLSDNQNRAHSAETDLHSLQQHLKDKDLEIKVMATTMTLLCPLISFYVYIVRKYEVRFFLNGSRDLVIAGARSIANCMQSQQSIDQQQSLRI